MLSSVKDIICTSNVESITLSKYRVMHPHLKTNLARGLDTEGSWSSACRFPFERLLLTASDSTGCPGNSIRRLHSRRSMGKAAAGFSAPKSIKYLAVTRSLIRSLASRAGRHYDIVLTIHDRVAAFSAYGRWRNLCETITKQRNVQIIK